MLKKKKSKDTTLSVDESSYENFPTKVDSYEIVGQIGKGAFASVYKAICIEMNNQEVALKVIELEKDESTEEKDKGQSSNWEEIQKEASIMRRMHHPNIVSCHAVFTVHTELWLVLPFLKGGSCADLMKSMKKFKNGFKDEAIIATIVNDILNGINYCHNDGRIHRDIKAANILLSASGIAQLSDFGVSGAIIEGGLRKPGRDTFTGSLWWMAPEVLQRENKHSFPADIWSLGITALELAYGKPPHSSHRPVKVMLTILQSPSPTLELYEIEEKEKGKEKDNNGNNNGNKIKWSKDFRKFLGLCLQKDSEKRATSKELLKHSWLKHAKEHSYIVENVLKDAPELKVYKNKPLPQSIQPKQGQIDNQNHDSIKFRFVCLFIYFIYLIIYLLFFHTNKIALILIQLDYQE